MTKLASDPGPLKAYELVMAFAARRGEAALRLAMHAALPQVLRPELLHLIRLNFLPESTYDLAIEADVLFASFCEDIGNGYYCFAANARLQLLQGLDPAYRDELMPRSMQVARFMLDYMDHEERDVRTGSDRLRSDWIEVERWSALAFAEPALAAGQLAVALARATATDDVAARVRVGGLASALATPLARFGELLTYAEGVEALQMGRAEDASRLFQSMPDREIEIEGVLLKSPRQVLAKSIEKETPEVLVTEPSERRGVTDETSDQHASIVGNSPAIRFVVEEAKRAATSDMNVLLLGEIGTGKGLFAQVIHQWSHRAAMPFTVINCAALPETLLESEMFGHEPGAFTGALGQQKGKFEMADGGTVFLDEIGQMSLSLQTALLRVLQDQEIYRVGGSKAVSVNIRIIAATNKNLRQAIRLRQFREDLYFRLNIVTLTLPPLRERLEDIPVLAKFLLDRHKESGLGRTLSTAAIEKLIRYHWPGNIQELENVIVRAVILCPKGTIEPEMLGLPNLAEAEEQSIEQGTPVRDQIYISYSHSDEKWRTLLMPHLNPAIKDLGLSVSWGREMGVGDDWERGNERAIARARLAIIMISPNYLASDYLMGRDLSRLIELARSNDLWLRWVYVEPCMYEASQIGEFLALHETSRPLSVLTPQRRDRVLVEIVGHVKELFLSYLDKKREAPKPEPAPSKRTSIFISYRREDSADVTGRIYDRLIQHFDREAVVQDEGSIPVGVDFRKHLDEQVSKCDVFLAVIGRDWMKLKGRKGKTRLKDPRDFLRIEIESALKYRIPVIPVLVRGATIPPAEQLPASMQDLSYRQGIVLRPDPDFHHDMDRLIEAIEQYGGFEKSPRIIDNDAQKNQAFVVGSDVVLFMKGISSDRRQDIINSSLLAQLVANKQVPDRTNTSQWYKAYFEVLQNIGWVIQDTSFSSYTEEANGLEVHEAFLKVSSALFGASPATLAIVMSTLEALKSIDSSKPWKVIFDRESEHANTRHFQIVLAEEGDNGQFIFYLMGLCLKSSSLIPSTLFFKIHRDEVNLEKWFGNATVNGEVLTSVSVQLKDKIGAHSASYIAKLMDLE